MSDPTLREIEALFAEALARPAAEREAFLDAACEGRPGLREEVASLLAAHEDAGDFLGTTDLSGSAAPTPGGRDATGLVVGAFRLLDRIGAGGMGSVYRAERADGSFEQIVAVKLVSVPDWSEDALRWFQAERQILASLRHPNIVTLFDGGLTGDGRAFLAMEYIEGRTIVEHCDEAGLSIESRLALFQQVAAAVDHAHRHFVVHRDLKPANILVTPEGVAKVLDFGVAKLIEESEQVESATRTGLLRPLTPNYASPEQLRGLPSSTASDIYALGVLLYELLSGARPYETRGKPFDEILGLVTDETRRPPSAAVESPALRRQLRGDLDAIVLKAMARDPERRYASAREMADDIDRHAAGQPVLARDPALGYHVRRLVRRHRAAASAVAVSVLALAIALGVSLWQTRVAQVERNRAEQRFQDLSDLAFTMIFEISNIVSLLPGSTEAREMIVERALPYLEELAEDVGEDTDLEFRLAQSYGKIADIQGLPGTPNLGQTESALANYARALEMLDEVAARQGPSLNTFLEIAKTNLNYSYTTGGAGQYDEAQRAIARADAAAQQAVEAAPDDYAAKRMLGSVLFRRAVIAPEDAQRELWERAAVVFDDLLADAPEDSDRQRNAALVSKYLGGWYEQAGDLNAAREHFERAYELDAARVAASPGDAQAALDLAFDLSTLGTNAGQLGEWDQAATRFEETLALRQRLSEAAPEDAWARRRVAFAMSRLGNAYSHIDRPDDAVPLLGRAIELANGLGELGSTAQVDRADFHMLLGGALQRAGRAGEACRMLRRAADVVEEQSVGGESPPEFESIESELRTLMQDCPAF